MTTKKKYIRASEIVKEYPLGLSTIWSWAKTGKLTPIKVSTGVTVFEIEEINNLFKPKTKKVRRRKRIKNTQTANSTQGRKNV